MEEVLRFLTCHHNPKRYKAGVRSVECSDLYHETGGSNRGITEVRWVEDKWKSAVGRKMDDE